MAWQPLPSLAAAVKLGEDRTAVQELLARTHQTNKTVHSVPLQELPPELQLACAAKFGKAFSRSQEKALAQCQGKHVLAAVIPVGLILSHPTEGSMHIGHLGVAKNFRRQGAGKQLTATVESLAGDLGHATLTFVPRDEKSATRPRRLGKSLCCLAILLRGGAVHAPLARRRGTGGRARGGLSDVSLGCSLYSQSKHRVGRSGGTATRPRRLGKCLCRAPCHALPMGLAFAPRTFLGLIPALLQLLSLSK